MRERRPHDGTDFDHPAALRRAPPAWLSLAVAAAPLAFAYAMGHPVQAAAALSVFAVLAVTWGRLEA